MACLSPSPIESFLLLTVPKEVFSFYHFSLLRFMTLGFTSRVWVASHCPALARHISIAKNLSTLCLELDKLLPSTSLLSASH